MPDKVWRAAKHGQADIVAAWLESGGGINDVDGGGFEGTMLLHATHGPRSTAEKGAAGKFDEDHVALARQLIERGADVNLSDSRGTRRCISLHLAVRGTRPQWPLYC